jgi:hypothetical protein
VLSNKALQRTAPRAAAERHNVGRTLLLSTLLGLVLAAKASASPKCPSGETILDALSVKAQSWEPACSPVDDGRILIAAVERSAWTDGKHHVVAAIADQGGARSRVEIPLTTSESKEVAQATSDAEEWKVEIRSVRLGEGRYIRLGVFVNHGEDYFLGQEIALLLRIGPDSITPVWTGLGDQFDRRFDSCVLDTRARFSLAGDGRLSRVRETKRSFRNAGIDGKLAADLRKKCVAPPNRSDVFPMR